MSDTEVQSPTPESQEPPAPKDQGNPTFKFVLIFVSTVLITLFGYRMLIDTVVNDWYLFKVAQSTRLALDWIGHEALLERGTHHAASPRQVRASLEAWKTGQDPQSLSNELQNFSGEPLSAWEKWHYRAELSRRLDTHKEQGPEIVFVFKPGLFTFLQKAQLEKKTIRTDENLDEAARQEALKEVNDRIKAIREDISAVRNLEEGAAPPEVPLQAVSFVFIIVSECGAIEIMAIFLAAVFAFPTSFRSKVIGTVLGIPIMYFLNIFRLACLATLGAVDKGGKWFDFVHHYVWQSVYIIFVVFVWLAWVEFFARKKQSDE